MTETPGPYEPFPTGADDARHLRRPTPPTTINVAAVCFLVSTVVGVVSAILVFGLKSRIADGIRNADTGRLTEDQIQQAAQVSVIIAAVVALISAAIYLWLALKLRAGRNWARIVLTVLTVLHLISLVTGRAGTGNVLGFIAPLAAVVGLVFAYLPASTAFLNAVKHSRR